MISTSSSVSVLNRLIADVDVGLGSKASRIGEPLRGWQRAARGVLVRRDRRAELVQSCAAVYALGLVPRATERGHEDRHQQRDDRDHDQQLDQRERRVLPFGW